MNKLDNLILEAYKEVLNEMPKGAQLKIKDLPKAMIDRLEKQYGPVDPKRDFFSKNLDTYYKFTNRNATTGSIEHKIIRLPSFFKMYDDFQNIVDDIKSLMRSDDIRKDSAARELFELIKTNFRKLQTYLRTERPEQYSIIRSRVTLEGLVRDFKVHCSLIAEQKGLLDESLLDQVNEQEPEPEEPGEEKGAVLEDATDKILGKFPTLRTAIIKLQTEDFKEFVESIDWISPRPTSFRINLKNGQDYILKWTGKTFEAQILGKRYLLSNIAEYQQALDKLAILYKEAPFSGAGEGEPVDTDTGGGGGGGGDFPGGDAAGGGGEEGGDEVDALGGEEGGEEGGADLGGEPIDFEEPGEEPEA